MVLSWFFLAITWYTAIFCFKTTKTYSKKQKNPVLSKECKKMHVDTFPNTITISLMTVELMVNKGFDHFGNLGLLAAWQLGRPLKSLAKLAAGGLCAFWLGLA